jgi:hypothetical protein
MPIVRYAAALTLTALAGCAQPPPWDFSGCDPIDEALCALPWPSDFHAVPEPASPTGWRVRLRSARLPGNVDGAPIRVDYLNERDGFSIGSPMLAAFGQVDLSALPGHASIDRSLTADAASILLDARTGERVAHWVEVDAHAQDPADRLTVLWPARALDYGGHYIVAYRGLRREGGAEVLPSAAFAALRDGLPTSVDDVEGRRAHYEQVIFPALAEHGFDRASLTLAWDFHTASRAAALGRAELIRDDALARVGAAGPAYRITTVEENDCDTPGQTTFRILRGRFTVPSYTEEPGANQLLTRGPDGMPFANGEREPSFLVRVPCSLRREPGPAFVLQYGHGLLGSEGEARTGWLGPFLDEHRMIAVAAQWTGMASEDYGAIALMLVEDIGRFAIIPERSQQGFVEQALVLRLALSGLTADPNLIIEGVPLIQPGVSGVGYYGISQGGILGGAYMGFSTELERGVLGVGGAPYPMLLPRSVDFENFFKIVKTMYPSELEQMFLIHGLFIHLWDVGESVGWAHDLVDSPPGIPSKRILSQIALGDAQVHVEGSRYQARSLELSSLSPTVRPVWGVPERSAPFDGSGYVEYDYGVPEPPGVNLPPAKATDTHECVRRTREAQLQVAHFLKTGEVRNFCNGPCAFTVEDGC